jgi:hypothetical protein
MYITIVSSKQKLNPIDKRRMLTCALEAHVKETNLESIY